MLSDEVLDKVIERLVNRIEQGNEYILSSIGNKIDEIGKLQPTQAIQLQQMIKYGGDYNKIVKKLAEITKMNKKDIEKIFKEVAKSNHQFAKQFYDYRNVKYVPYDDNAPLKKQVEALAKITNDKYTEIARSKALGFSVRNKKGNIIFKGLKEVYDEAIDTAVMSIAQGKSTFNNEIYKFLKNIGESGVKTLDFNGKTMRLDSAMRMHLSDALMQLTDEQVITEAEAYDADGVEISVHAFPAIDHELAQGRQFSNDEFKKLQSDGVAKTYDDIEVDMHIPLKSGESPEYFRQIRQYNCKHHARPIVLGVSSPVYSNEDLQQIIDRNHKGFDFDGKHYTMYEGTQLQRKIETAIRKNKDLQILGRTSDNKQLANESQIKINQLNKKYKELSKVSGLPTYADRMKVSGYKPIKVVEKPVVERIEKTKVEQSIKSMQNNASKSNKIIDNKFNNTSKIFKASNEYLDLSNNENINIYNATNNLNLKIYERPNIKNAYYSRVKKQITTTGVKQDNLKPTTTLWHEMGHALDNHKGVDNYASNSPEIRMAMYNYYDEHKEIPKNVEDYFNNLKESVYDEFKEKNNFDDYYNNYIEIKKQQGETEWNLSVYKDRFENNKEDYMRMVKSDYNRNMRQYYNDKCKTNMSYAQLGNLSDMFSAISKGGYNAFCGLWGYHTKSYFNERVENPTTELFADFVSLKMTGCKEHLDFFKKEAPDIYKELEKLFITIGDELNAK